MLRIGLFVFAAAMAGSVSAQVNSDPQAVAPVVYSGAPQNTGCDSSVYNADGSPVISCDANAQQQQSEGDYADGSGYAQDYSAYDNPDYSGSNFYLGVSALPYGYWYPGLAFGWPYYGYGFGYAYAPYAFWGGYYAFGWGGYYGHYHGPYHYGYAGHDGHWDHGHSGDHSGDHGHSGSPSGHSGTPYATANAGTSHAIGGSPGTPGSTRSPVADSRANSPREGLASGGAHAMHASLPSASYVAAAQRGGTAAGPALANRATAAMAERTTNGEHGSVAGRTANARSTNPYHVSSMPNRGYSTSGYRNGSGGTARSYGSPAQRGYAMSRGPYGMPQQRYSSQPYGGRGGMPSYSRGGGMAMHGGGGGAPHASGGVGHAGVASRGH